MGFRITTWNGLIDYKRNPFSYEPWRGTRTFEAMFDILEADIVVFQEAKIQRKDLRDDMVLVPGWDCYFSLPKAKKGYSGVVVYTRNSTCAPIRFEEGITGVLSPPNSSVRFRDLPEDQQIGGYPTLKQLRRTSSNSDGSDQETPCENSSPDDQVDAATLDSEGRCVILEFPAFVLIGVYSPAFRDEARDIFRMDFLNALDARVRNLVAMGKRVFLTGDINIAKGACDSAHAMESIRKCVTTAEEYISSPPRKLFHSLLSDGVVIGQRDKGREQPVLHDICRSFHPERSGMYTCWDTKLNTRPGNFGSRIDYVLCSLDMQDWFSDSNIQEGLMGSDHCPVFAVFKDQVQHDQAIIHIRDIMNPPGIFKCGERQQEYSSRYMLPTSARLLPEFDVDKRRSIKDMFARKPPKILSQSTSTTNTTEKLDISSSSITAEPATFHPNYSASTLPTPFAGTPLQALPRKRPQTTSVVPVKRQKSVMNSSNSAGSGQKTLKGFFKPKAAECDAPSQPDTQMPANTSSFNLDKAPNNAKLLSNSSQRPYSIANDLHSNDADAFMQSSPHRFQADTIIDPIVSKEDWTKLFTKKPIPRCEEHQEPCISMTTKKPGINRGRAFWVCSRPLGPSGEKEKGTEWRCATFIWASDWNSPMQQAEP
ncbi:hypothetical protein N7495_009482 [Penicillium taxi]|uniref:uncharacterized protein n=1 Tax=Penicillium taxi TaxID=168475 RepID=UPI002545ACBF|nr:uncharacterized protein N7495_009482 [Penicillium taxi]KAJ5884972.1 hypothetical protein N7495_009482 [Penicillium taxi]